MSEPWVSVDDVARHLGVAKGSIYWWVALYDEVAKAARTGKPYQTRLDPPPADPRVAHPPRDKQAESAP